MYGLGYRPPTKRELDLVYSFEVDNVENPVSDAFDIHDKASDYESDKREYAGKLQRCAVVSDLMIKKLLGMQPKQDDESSSSEDDPLGADTEEEDLDLSQRDIELCVDYLERYKTTVTTLLERLYPGYNDRRISNPDIYSTFYVSLCETIIRSMKKVKRGLSRYFNDHKEQIITLRLVYKVIALTTDIKMEEYGTHPGFYEFDAIVEVPPMTRKRYVKRVSKVVGKNDLIRRLPIPESIEKIEDSVIQEYKDNTLNLEYNRCNFYKTMWGYDRTTFVPEVYTFGPEDLETISKLWGNDRGKLHPIHNTQREIEKLVSLYNKFDKTINGHPLGKYFKFAICGGRVTSSLFKTPYSDIDFYVWVNPKKSRALTNFYLDGDINRKTILQLVKSRVDCWENEINKRTRTFQARYLKEKYLISNDRNISHAIIDIALCELAASFGSMRPISSGRNEQFQTIFTPVTCINQIIGSFDISASEFGFMIEEGVPKLYCTAKAAYYGAGGLMTTNPFTAESLSKVRTNRCAKYINRGFELRYPYAKKSEPNSTFLDFVDKKTKLEEETGAGITDTINYSEIVSDEQRDIVVENLSTNKSLCCVNLTIIRTFGCFPTDPVSRMFDLSKLSPENRKKYEFPL